VFRVANPPPTALPLAVFEPKVAWLSTPIADSIWNIALRPAPMSLAPLKPMFEESAIGVDNQATFP